MLSKTLESIIEAAVSTELIDAKRVHGERYASAHEGYGVLMEELHEATKELHDLRDLIHGPLIEDIHDHEGWATICDLECIEQTAQHLACEAVQVAAVARKYSETLAELWKEEDHA